MSRVQTMQNDRRGAQSPEDSQNHEKAMGTRLRWIKRYDLGFWVCSRNVASRLPMISRRIWKSCSGFGVGGQAHGDAKSGLRWPMRQHQSPHGQRDFRTSTLCAVVWKLCRSSSD